MRVLELGRGSPLPRDTVRVTLRLSHVTARALAAAPGDYYVTTEPECCPPARHSVTPTRSLTARRR